MSRRRLAGWSAVGLLVGALVACVVLLVVQQRDLNDRLDEAQRVLRDEHVALRANVNAQVVNRAQNVWTWCRAINGGREYDRLFILHVTHGRVSYGLNDLPCALIVARTLASTKH